ncbi:hypothetical protein [Serratia ureilytica]|uniref:hypothetical protein n=1 Tax=Serratia ureilytica TaxID=300181 RepID=UPI0018D98421|nr:hypothetical protein [Serratia ureilytica]MBH2515594.1 hypothetical protein [Serratia ureilytica]MBH2532160.1 hypothetical protein [Serratia ureilytica]
MEAKWLFVDNKADESDGFSNPGVELFRDSPVSSVARECGQNSIDAALDNEIVKINFECLDVGVSEIPDYNSLLKTMRYCKNKLSDSKDRRANLFFDRAVNLLNQPRIKILKITDSGTTGLSGPCIEGTPYYALLRSSGTSEKGNNTAGGSFGIGKNATFAVSEIRSVFYTTNYRDKETGEKIFLCQGKASLISHKNDRGERFRGSGYCGEDDFQPIKDSSKLPSWLQLENIGTSISIVGFDDSDDWEERITETLTRNFFSAIHMKKVIFNIGRKHTINKDNLPYLFKEDKIKKTAEREGYKDEFNFSHSLYRCITSDLSLRKVIEIDGIGKLKVHLLIENGLPKKVGFIRNGMYITNELSNFSDKLKQFYSLKDFIAVVEPIDEKSISIFRELENPQHNSFSPLRYIEKDEQNNIKAKFAEMSREIRHFIKSNTENSSEEELLIEELNEFFPIDGHNCNIPCDNNDTDNLDLEKTKVRKVKLNVMIGKEESPSINRGSKYKRGKEKQSGNEPPRNDGELTGHNDGIGTSISFNKLRTKLGTDDYERVIFLTPQENGIGKIRIFTPGISSQDEIDVISVNNNKKKEIKLSKNERLEFNVKLAYPYKGPIIVAIEIPGDKNENKK